MIIYLNKESKLNSIFFVYLLKLNHTILYLILSKFETSFLELFSQKHKRRIVY